MKPLYHCALTVASNFMVLLGWLSWMLTRKTGLDDRESRELLLGLMNGTLSNLEEMAPEDALTGPVERGDWQTIKKHIEALEEDFPEFLDFYRNGTALLLGIARARGAAPVEGLDRIERMMMDLSRRGRNVMTSENDQQLEVVFRPKDELQGRILEGVLGGEDIPCFLRSRQIPWMDDIMELVEGYWGELLVPKSEAERARTVIESYLEGEENQ